MVCANCGSTGHPTGSCCHCGGSRHETSVCPIYQKVKLAEMGVPIEYLFTEVVKVDSLEELPDIVQRLREGKE